MNLAFKKLTIVVIFLVLFSGCGYISPLFQKESCGMYLVLQNKIEVDSTDNIIKPNVGEISIGMSKEQVTAMWGKPDRYIDYEQQEWIYSNENKSKAQQYITYWIFFKNDNVLKIEKLLFKKEYHCRTNDL